MLIAGATGSGKSVSVNSMILSILYKASPEDVRLLMVDPKMLELSIYEGIPHLLLPVVTDPKKASLALRWAVREMERRYHLMSDVNARDILSYNKSAREPLPHIVFIIDELADLMARDALAREESCGGHFREESVTDDGEAKRNDEAGTYVSAWEYKGENQEPLMHKEELKFENIELAQRSYK